MGLFKAASILLTLASVAASFPTLGALTFSSSTGNDAQFSSSRVVESLSSPPRGWVLDDTAVVNKDEAAIRLRVHLVHQDMDKFHDLALNIATPGHASYGNHLDQKTIDALIAPKDESGDLVMRWLEAAGLRSHATYSSRGDSIIIEASVAQVEKLLSAEYNVYCRLFPFPVHPLDALDLLTIRYERQC